MALDRTRRDQARREEKARAAGYENYYQYRVRGTKAGGRARVEARGHAGETRAFQRAVGSADIVFISPSDVRRRKDGSFDVTATVVDREGRERTFQLRGVTRERLERLRGRGMRGGAMFTSWRYVDEKMGRRARR